MRLIVGISGASGIAYAIRLLQSLRAIEGCETHLVISKGAKLAIRLESRESIGDIEALADEVHSDRNLAASIASGSFRTDGMVVVPCSMKTLSAIANSYGANLLVRAADVTLKEGRRLILVPRETPLHAGHLRLMHEAALMGAIIAPPVPAFYSDPQSVQDIVDDMVGRLLDLLGIDNELARRWQGPESGIDHD
ncbi:MAG: UbiX family flavin prenyltransferase [Gammaproteobacteria bacterium]|nr:UbiX family flavin prenyltransferase [Gammaproteobacteria bacterium]